MAYGAYCLSYCYGYYPEFLYAFPKLAQEDDRYSQPAC